MTNKSTAVTSLLNDQEFAALKNYLVTQTGLSYYANREADLAAKIHDRMAAVHVDQYGQYLAVLQDHSQGETELDALIELLTIGETYFFRHTEVFDALRDTLLPELLHSQRRCRRLRIWSAGCATGAEAYSMSILLRHMMGTAFRDWQITIIGTDINRQYLSKARDGRFENWAFRCTPPAIKQACFRQQGSCWELLPEFKRDVTFQYHNLVRHTFPSLVHNLYGFDIILCRNVMIYFNEAINRQIAGRLRESLGDGGWLIVGHAEYNPQLFADYDTLHADGAVLYRRKFRQSFPPLTTVPKPVFVPATAPGNPTRNTPANDARQHTLRTDAAVTATASRQTVRELNDLQGLRRLADAGQVEVAESRCARLLAKRPHNKTLLLYHALLAHQLNKIDLAEQSLRQAIQLAPDYVLAYYYLGIILVGQHKPREAGNAYHRVLKLLQTCREEQAIDDAEGLNAAELRVMTELQIATLREPAP